MTNPHVTAANLTMAADRRGLLPAGARISYVGTSRPVAEPFGGPETPEFSLIDAKETRLHTATAEEWVIRISAAQRWKAPLIPEPRTTPGA